MTTKRSLENVVAVILAAVVMVGGLVLADYRHQQITDSGSCSVFQVEADTCPDHATNAR